MQPSAPGDCELCPKLEHVRATNTFTDRLGFVYRLCPRHYEPLRVWQERLRHRERKRQNGRGILTVDDFLVEHDGPPDG